MADPMSVKVAVPDLGPINKLINGRRELEQEASRQLAEVARNIWARAARESLSKRKRDLTSYLDAIGPVEITRGVASVALVGAIALGIETGRAAVDMKNVLLGPKVGVSPRGQPGKHRSAAGGYYRAVPTGRGIRTISTNSPKGSWIRAAVPGVHVMLKVRSELAQKAPDVVAHIVAAMNKQPEKKGT